MTTESTQQLILATALSFVQAKGYNGFSYRDIAEKIGIKTASIHYYFPKKSDLGKSLMVDYRTRFKDALQHIDQDTDGAIKKLQKFTNLFIRTLEQENQMCLCGMLASDINTLPREIVEEIKKFITDTEKWLTHVLISGCETGCLQIDGNPEDQAKTMFAALEGAMITARTFNDKRRLEKVTKQLHTVIMAH
jgi:TetR/AcrR family transcriptional repressor of nem operon